MSIVMVFEGSPYPPPPFLVDDVEAFHAIVFSLKKKVSEKQVGIIPFCQYSQYYSHGESANAFFQVKYYFLYGEGSH